MKKSTNLYLDELDRGTNNTSVGSGGGGLADLALGDLHK